MQDWYTAVERITAYVEEHIGEHPSLVDMARRVGYSPTYCSTVFHRVSGMTIRNYIAARRLSLAAMALRDTREPIVQIALDFGFSSQLALARAFQDAFGMSPGKYRAHPTPIPLQIRLRPSRMKIEEGEMIMSKMHQVDVRTEYIPAHKYLGAYRRSETKRGPVWPGHDCDLLCGMIESMTNTDRIVTAYTAGWDHAGDERTYFFGSGIDAGAREVAVPEGMELRECPGSYYLVFAYPPFQYPEENAAVMAQVEQIAWSFDPTPLGLAWNEQECQCYQRHNPELLGYQVLRPVKVVP